MVFNSLGKDDIVSKSGLQLPYKPEGKARIMLRGEVGSWISKNKNFLFAFLSMNEQIFLIIIPRLSQMFAPVRNRNQVTASYMGLIFEDL